LQRFAQIRCFKPCFPGLVRPLSLLLLSHVCCSRGPPAVSGLDPSSLNLDEQARAALGLLAAVSEQRDDYRKRFEEGVSNQRRLEAELAANVQKLRAQRKVVGDNMVGDCLYVSSTAQLRLVLACCSRLWRPVRRSPSTWYCALIAGDACAGAILLIASPSLVTGSVQVFFRGRACFAAAS